MKNRTINAIGALLVWLIIRILVFIGNNFDNFSGIDIIYIIILIAVGTLISMGLPLISYFCNGNELLNKKTGVAICIINGIFVIVLSNIIAMYYDVGMLAFGIIDGFFIYLFNLYLFVKPKNYVEKAEDSDKFEEGTKNELSRNEELKQEIIEKTIVEYNENSDLEHKRRFCTKCGKIIDGEWDYCYYCGNKLK